jgi:VanZ family protein
MLKKKLFTNRYYLSVIAVAVNAFLVAFIFARSLQPADISQQESETALDFLSYIFPFELSDHIVRKLAHFVEFAFLGMVTTVTVFSFARKPLKGTFVTLFLCLATAVTDEMLQLNVSGRSSQVSDVILDFSGSFTGIVFATLIITIIYMRKG